MSDSLLGDRIVLEIQNRDARKRLLQDRKLDLKRCIDICWTSERATTHPQVLVGKHEVVNRVDRRANDLSKKIRKQGDRTEPSFEEKNTEPRKLKWKFCPRSHVLKKELCLAWGERYNVQWITGRVQKFGHGRENTLSKSRLWLFWLGLGCGPGADSQRLC